MWIYNIITLYIFFSFFPFSKRLNFAFIHTRSVHTTHRTRTVFGRYNSKDHVSVAIARTTPSPMPPWCSNDNAVLLLSYHRSHRRSCSHRRAAVSGTTSKYRRRPPVPRRRVQPPSPSSPFNSCPLACTPRASCGDRALFEPTRARISREKKRKWTTLWIISWPKRTTRTAATGPGPDTFPR